MRWDFSNGSSIQFSATDDPLIGSNLNIFYFDDENEVEDDDFEDDEEEDDEVDEDEDEEDED